MIGEIWYEILRWLFREEGFAWREVVAEDGEHFWLYLRLSDMTGWPLNAKLLNTMRPEFRDELVRKVIRIVEQAPLPDEV